MKPHSIAIARAVFLVGGCATTALAGENAAEINAVKIPTIIYLGRSEPRPLDQVVRDAKSTVTVDDLTYECLSHCIKSMNQELGKQLDLQACWIGPRSNVQEEIQAYSRMLQHVESWSTAEQENLVCIIDATWGVHVANVQQQLRRLRIPHIQVNGDKLGTDLGESALFLGQDDYIPEMLAMVLKAASGSGSGDDRMLDRSMSIALEERRSLLVMEDDADFQLTTRFAKSFVSDSSETGVAGITYLPPKVQFGSDLAKWTDRCRQRLYASTGWYCRQSDVNPDSLVITNTRRDVTKMLIETLNQHGVTGCTLLGGPYIVGDLRDPDLLVYLERGNRIVIATYPQDSLSSAMADAIANLRRYRKTPLHPNEFLFAKRALEAAGIIETCLLDKGLANPDAFIPLRDRVAKGLVAVRQSGSVETRAGLLEFTREGARVLTPRFELLDSEGRKSLPYQLLSTLSGTEAHWRLVPNIGVGVQIDAVRQLDIGAGTFVADVYYTIRAPTDALLTEHSAQPAQPGKLIAIDELAKSIYFRNLIQPLSVQDLGREETGGLTYALFRLCGVFAAEFDATGFPFDSQSVPLELAVSRGSHDVVVSLESTSLGQPLGGLPKIRADGWNVTTPTLNVGQTLFYYDRYDPALYIGRGRSAREHPSILLEARLDRQLSQTMLVIVGAMLLLVVSWIVAWRSLGYSDDERLAVIFGVLGLLAAMLTLYAQERPEVSSVMFSDVIALTITVVSAFVVARSHRGVRTIDVAQRGALPRVPVVPAIDQPVGGALSGVAHDRADAKRSEKIEH